jgi:hypothetical protein
MMFPFTNPPAIEWTVRAPSYETIAFEELSVDIPTLQVWIDREQDLSAIGRYGQNWDGFDAAPPDPLVVGRAAAFLRLLRLRDRANPPLRVSLSPDGHIGLEWLRANTLKRVEIGDSAEIEWMVATPGRPTKFTTESFGTSREQAWRPPEEADDPALASAR